MEQIVPGGKMEQKYRSDSDTRLRACQDHFESELEAGWEFGARCYAVFRSVRQPLLTN